MASKTGRHSREEIAAFLTPGETAQVVARDTRNGDLVVMENGQALELREIAKAHFACPVEACTSPRLETVGGKTRRHHFRHASGGGHTGAVESMLHLQAKFILGDWARQSARRQGLDVDVIVDEAFVTDEDRRRRRKPDVLVRFVRGVTLALEVEYFNSTNESSLTARRSDYSAMDVRDVWVFGHSSRHLRQPRTSDYAPEGHVAFASLSAALAAAGDPVLVINPLEGVVGTLVRHVPSGGWLSPGDRPWWEHPDDFGLVFPHEKYPSDTAELRLDRLDDCMLDAHYGILTPTIRAVLESRQQMRAQASQARAEAEERARQQEAALALAKARAIADKAARQEAADNALKRRETALQLRADRERQWQRDPLRQRILAAGRGMPKVIGTELPNDSGVFAYHEKWHAIVFEALVLGKPLGSTFLVGDVYRVLGKAGIQLHGFSDRRGKAVVGCLRYLRDSGHLRFTTSGVMVTGPITVVANTLVVQTHTAVPPEPGARIAPPKGADQEAIAVAESEPERIRPLRPDAHWHVRAGRYLKANRDVTVDGLRAATELGAEVSDGDIAEFIAQLMAYWAERESGTLAGPLVAKNGLHLQGSPQSGPYTEPTG